MHMYRLSRDEVTTCQQTDDSCRSRSGDRCVETRGDDVIATGCQSSATTHVVATITPRDYHY